MGGECDSDDESLALQALPPVQPQHPLTAGALAAGSRVHLPLGDQSLEDVGAEHPSPCSDKQSRAQLPPTASARGPHTQSL
ncbi:hypothetical protein T492DRAFT_900329, partial [Pavlovales sp. CCMP2436]